MAEQGNPEPAAPTDKKETEQESYSFPLCTKQPIRLQSKVSGDMWMGFNPFRMTRRQALAWAILQVENTYAVLEEQIAEAAAVQKDKKHWTKKILSPFQS